MTNAVRVHLKEACRIAAIIAIGGTWVAFVYGAQTGLEWINGSTTPDAPGEACELSYNSNTGYPSGAECYPLPGWHMESWPNPQGRAGYAYVHDNASDARWRVDVATSFMWAFLSRQQQKEILDGKVTIEFRTAGEIDKVAIDHSALDGPGSSNP
jgi:hypothetical protein